MTIDVYKSMICLHLYKDLLGKNVLYFSTAHEKYFYLVHDQLKKNTFLESIVDAIIDNHRFINPKKRRRIHGFIVQETMSALAKSHCTLPIGSKHGLFLSMTYIDLSTRCRHCWMCSNLS